jgi:hypothetical protein
MNEIERRLTRLEAVIKVTACAVCRDWPALAFVYDADASDYAERCPRCGRRGPITVRCYAVSSRETNAGTMKMEHTGLEAPTMPTAKAGASSRR